MPCVVDELLTADQEKAKSMKFGDLGVNQWTCVGFT